MKLEIFTENGIIDINTGYSSMREYSKTHDLENIHHKNDTYDEYDYVNEMIRECLSYFKAKDKNKNVRKVPSRYLFNKKQVEYILKELEDLSNKMAYAIDDDGIFEVNFKITLMYNKRKNIH